MENLRMRKRLSRFPILLPILMVFLLWGAPASFAYYAPLQDVIAWLDGSTVHYKVYDPFLGKWMEGSSSASSTATIKVQEGIVAWHAADASRVAIYDPASQSWVKDKIPSAYGGPNIIVKDGVVAMIGNSMSCYNYNGTGWEKRYKISIGFGYAINAGFVANASFWYGLEYNIDVYARVGGVGDGYRVFTTTETQYPVEDLSIDGGGTITWTYKGDSYKVGYFDGEWHVGQDSKPKASFFGPALTNGNTWFADLSLAATSWHYDFGDGTTSTERSPLHTYAQEGTYIVTQTVTSPNGSDTTTRTVTVEQTPPTGTIVINTGAQYTNSRNVSLSLSATDVGSGVAWMRFSNDCATWNNWQAYKTGASRTLTLGSGTKTVYVQFKDVAGNVSSTYSDSIVLDTTPPWPRSIRINAGAPYTPSRNVTLSLLASDALSGVSKMRFSNTPADLASWSSWRTYGTSSSWTLTTGDELKTVGVQFIDGAGNVGSAQDSITLDTNAPLNCSISINAGLTYTNSREVTLSLYAGDETSGVKQVRFKQYDLQNETPWGSWLKYLTQRTLYLLTGDGRKWVEAQFKDGAGNISPMASDTIILDRTRPSVGTLKAVAGSSKVTLSWSGFQDPLSGIKSYLLYFSTQPFTSRSEATKIYEGTGLSFAHTDLNPMTTYYYRVYAQDKAGNISAGAPAKATTN